MSRFIWFPRRIILFRTRIRTFSKWDSKRIGRNYIGYIVLDEAEVIPFPINPAFLYFAYSGYNFRYPPFIIHIPCHLLLKFISHTFHSINNSTKNNNLFNPILKIWESDHVLSYLFIIRIYFFNRLQIGEYLYFPRTHIFVKDGSKDGIADGFVPLLHEERK